MHATDTRDPRGSVREGTPLDPSGRSDCGLHARHKFGCRLSIRPPPRAMPQASVDVGALGRVVVAVATHNRLVESDAMWQQHQAQKEQQEQQGQRERAQPLHTAESLLAARLEADARRVAAKTRDAVAEPGSEERKKRKRDKSKKKEKKKKRRRKEKEKKECRGDGKSKRSREEKSGEESRRGSQKRSKADHTSRRSASGTTSPSNSSELS